MKVINAVVLAELNDGKGVRQIYADVQQKEALMSFIYSGHIGSPIQVSEKILDSITIEQRNESEGIG